MGTFTVTSSSLNSSYEYKDESIVVSGSYQKDATNDTLTRLDGACHKANEDGGQGEYIGNFNGYQRNDEVRYSLSEMGRKDSLLVWDAIDAIEAEVTGTANG